MVLKYLFLVLLNKTIIVYCMEYQYLLSVMCTLSVKQLFLYISTKLFKRNNNFYLNHSQYIMKHINWNNKHWH